MLITNIINYDLMSLTVRQSNKLKRDCYKCNYNKKSFPPLARVMTNNT